jgi:hypothetical protein
MAGLSEVFGMIAKNEVILDQPRQADGLAPLKEEATVVTTQRAGARVAETLRVAERGDRDRYLRGEAPL